MNKTNNTKRDIKIPCVNVKLISRDLVVANNYNPNSVPPEKLELLKQSIIDNGFCFPIVTIWDIDIEKYVIIDGFHRFLLCMPEYLDIIDVPIIVLDHDISKRMAATIQFNKARGVHQVDLDAEVIRSLIQQGLSEEEISVHLGMDIDTIHRYKQLTGIAELFKNTQYSMSWSVDTTTKPEQENAI
jgi:ParB-like chromosome segregation protein Spo0J